jgi:hypothetical protein
MSSMEVLIRVLCTCGPGRNQPCPICGGKGHIDRWVPFELLKQLKGWVILARRYATKSP